MSAERWTLLLEEGLRWAGWATCSNEREKTTEPEREAESRSDGVFGGLGTDWLEVRLSRFTDSSSRFSLKARPPTGLQEAPPNRRWLLPELLLPPAAQLAVTEGGPSAASRTQNPSSTSAISISSSGETRSTASVGKA